MIIVGKGFSVVFVFFVFFLLVCPAHAEISVEEMQEIFEGGFGLIVSVFMIGVGIGAVLKILRMGYER